MIFVIRDGSLYSSSKLGFNKMVFNIDLLREQLVQLSLFIFNTKSHVIRFTRVKNLSNSEFGNGNESTCKQHRKKINARLYKVLQGFTRF